MYMFQKGIRIMMILGTLLLIGLITTLIIRECKAENEDKQQKVEQTQPVSINYVYTDYYIS